MREGKVVAARGAGRAGAPRSGRRASASRTATAASTSCTPATSSTSRPRAALADALVVTVSPDRFVDKGPGRPAFPEQLRAESVAALECVDYAAVNRWPTAEETIRLLRPDYYVKGQEFERPEDRDRETSAGDRGGTGGRRADALHARVRLLVDGAAAEALRRRPARGTVSVAEILTLEEAAARCAALRAAGKTVVQSHGVFDLVHPGIVRHLEEARRQGDVLVVTVAGDRALDEGPVRPIFPEQPARRERRGAGPGRLRLHRRRGRPAREPAAAAAGRLRPGAAA